MQGGAHQWVQDTRASTCLQARPERAAWSPARRADVQPAPPSCAAARCDVVRKADRPRLAPKGTRRAQIAVIARWSENPGLVIEAVSGDGWRDVVSVHTAGSARGATAVLPKSRNPSHAPRAPAGMRLHARPRDPSSARRRCPALFRRHDPMGREKGPVPGREYRRRRGRHSTAAEASAVARHAVSI